MSQVSKVMAVGTTSQQNGQVLQLSTDDKEVFLQIQSSHCPDRNIVVDAKSLLNFSENILHTASPSPPLVSKKDSADPDDKASVISDALKSTIHKIGCELSCNSTGKGDLKAITLSVFKALTEYEWEAKVVLALAAFTASYGELSLLSKLLASSTLVKSVHILKPLPDISERESHITEHLKVLVQVSNCIIELINLPTQYISQDKDFVLPTQYISQDKAALSDALDLVPTIVYLAIKGIAACSVQSIGLDNIGHQYEASITEARKKLTELTQTLKSCSVQLTNQLVLCRKHIDDKMNSKVCDNLVHTILKTTHTDSREIFTALVDTKEELSLFYGVDKKRVSLDVLKGQTVMYFFSYHDISVEEIQEIKQLVCKQERKYEIVWMPIIKEGVISNVDIKLEIFRKASLMQWYSLDHSLELHPGAIKFVKEMWDFDKKPLLVAFNAQGNIITENAYQMLMTTWSLKDLFEERDRAQLVQEGKLVCFYGGDDTDWIRKFTSGIKEVVKVEELIYVGKKRKETIIKENLSKWWDVSQIKRFRARLESIMNSKMQLGLTIKTDALLKDVMTILGAEGSGEGWTLLAHGSEGMVTMNANLAMDWLAQFNNEKVPVTSESIFNNVKVYKEKVEVKDSLKHCNCIVVTNTNIINQESMVCVDCNRSMEKVTMYRCCPEK